MAAIDSTSDSGYQAAVSSFSWSHTCAAGAKLLVGVMADPTGLGFIAVTYNGVSLSQQSSLANGVLIQLWSLDSPISGSHTIVVDFGASVAVGAAAGAVSVLQTGSADDLEAAIGSGPSDLAVTLFNDFSDDFMIVLFGSTDTAVGLASPATETSNVSGTVGSIVMGYKAGSSTTESLTLTGIDSGKQACGIGISYLNGLKSAYGSSRVASKSDDVSIALAGTLGRSAVATNELPRSVGSINANGSSYSTLTSRVVNTFVVQTAGLSRIPSWDRIATNTLAKVAGREDIASIANGRLQSPMVALNARVFVENYSGGQGTIIVSGAQAAIGRHVSVTSSGAFAAVITPLVARGSDRNAVRSMGTSPASISAHAGSSGPRSRSAGRESVTASTEASERDYARSSGRAASRIPITGSERRTAQTSAASASSVAKVTGARSFTVRRSVSTSKIIVTALGLAESTGRDSSTFRVIVSTPARSIAVERDGATISVPAAALNAREIAAASDCQPTRSACFVASSTVEASWSKAGFYNVVDMVAARPFVVSRDSAGTRSAVFVASRSSTPARDSGPTVSLSFTVGTSIAATRDRGNMPLSFASVVVQDRVAVESSGRMITTAQLFASDAVRDSSTLSTATALPATLVGEPEQVVIN